MRSWRHHWRLPSLSARRIMSQSAQRIISQSAQRMWERITSPSPQRNALRGRFFYSFWSRSVSLFEIKYGGPASATVCSGNTGKASIAAEATSVDNEADNEADNIYVATIVGHDFRLDSNRGILKREPNGVNFPLDRRCYHHLVSVCDRPESDIAEDAKDIIKGAMKSADASRLLEKHIKVYKDHNSTTWLAVDEERYKLNNNLYIAGFGKGVLNLICRIGETSFAKHIVKGVAVIPMQQAESLWKNKDPSDGTPYTVIERIEVYGGAQDKRVDNYVKEASMKIVNMGKLLTEDDILIVLVTGGGSSLFQVPIDEEKLPQKAINQLIDELEAKGARRTNINMIRRHLSKVKGGKFAIMMSHTRLVTLIVSDVVGDMLDTIGSGVTFPEISTPQMCLDVLTYFNVDVPEISSFLKQEQELENAYKFNLASPLPPHRDISKFSHVQNVRLGNNQDLIQGAILTAEKLGYRALELSHEEFGYSDLLAQRYAKLLQYGCRLLRRKFEHGDKILIKLEMDLMGLGLDKSQANNVARKALVSINTSGGLCIIGGGEFLCRSHGGGRGGIHQELALLTAQNMHHFKDGGWNPLNEYSCVFLAIDSDGIDGNSEAAGAWVDGNVIKKAKKQGLDVQKTLEESSTYDFFHALDDGNHQIITGHSGMDLMGMVVMLIKPVDVDVDSYKVFKEEKESIFLKKKITDDHDDDDEEDDDDDDDFPPKPKE